MIRQLTTVLIGATAVLGHGGKDHDHEKKTHHHGKHEIRDVPQCLDGFVRKGGFCVRPVPVPKEPICPEGTLDDGTSCILLADGNVSCAQGKYVGNLFCEVTTSTEGRKECPKGSTLSGDQCLVGGLLKYCPAGFAETEEGRCVDTVAKEYSCPAGLKDTGDLCEEIQTAPIEQICPENTRLVDGLCEVDVEIEPTCPEGYSDEGKNCAVFEAPIRDICPEGYTFDPTDFSCIKLAQQPSVVECEGDAVLINGKCERIIEAPTEPVCEKGKLINGVCEVTGSVPAEYNCPPDYTLETTKKGKVCTRLVTYDCSYSSWKCKDEPFALPKEKKEHAKATHTGGHGKLRHLGKATLTQGKGHAHEHEKKYGYCHKEEVLVPKTCEETLVAEPIPYCEQGVFNGIECIISEVFPPVEKCTGVIIDDKCIVIETYPPVYRCPEGFSPIGNGSMCEQLVDLIGATERCPSGTTEFQGKCAIFVEKSCPAGGCIETVTWAPEDVCPTGFTLSRVGTHKVHSHGKGWNKSITHEKKIEKRCIKSVFTEKQAVCPTGYVPISATTCAAFTPIIEVDGEKDVPAQFLCPVGYEIVGTTCVQTGFIAADVTCPNGFTNVLNTELCAKDEPEVLGCPKGSHEIAGECFVDATTNPLLIPKHLLKVPMKTHGKTPVWGQSKANIKVPTVTFKKLPPIDIKGFQIDLPKGINMKKVSLKTPVQKWKF